MTGWAEPANDAPIQRTRRSERLLLVLLAGVPVPAATLSGLAHVHPYPAAVFARRLEWHGWVTQTGGRYSLTTTGRARALDLLCLGPPASGVVAGDASQSPADPVPAGDPGCLTRT